MHGNAELNILIPMKVSILCIGDELLNGRTLNTNATWISKSLFELGCTVSSQVVVPDNEKSIMLALKNLVNTNLDFVIITGGLGPTDDDITRQALFKFFKSSTTFDSDYWFQLKKRFKKFKKKIPEINKNQAIIPTNGLVIKNPIGSARGLQYKLNKTTFFSLPGVPSEMKRMIKDKIIPWLMENELEPKNVRIIRTTGIPESLLVEELSDEIKKNHGCDIGYYPSILGVDIYLSAYNQNLTDKLFDSIMKKQLKNIYAVGEDSIEKILIKKLKEKKVSLSVAESCTGGLIQNRLTNISGSSMVYKGGIVAYSNPIKIKVLKVKEKIIGKFGAVSKQTAEEMAKNIRVLYDTDIGLSVTGIAGPDGGSVDKPVGTVYISISTKIGIKTIKKQFWEDRVNNKMRISQAGLNFLRLSLQ